MMTLTYFCDPSYVCDPSFLPFQQEKELLRKKEEEIEEAERDKRNRVVMTFDLVGRKVLLSLIKEDVLASFSFSFLSSLSFCVLFLFCEGRESGSYLLVLL